MGTAHRVLFLGSFPPRECGIATFTRDVVEHTDRRFGTQSDVIAVDEPGGELRAYPPCVIARLTQDDRASYTAVARTIDAHPSDVLSVQHEYGLFGGDDGSWIVDLIGAVNKPVVVSLHTVLPEPTTHHRDVARAICTAASAVVVLSQTGRDILVKRYDIDARKIRVIHHGVPDVPFQPSTVAKAKLGLAGRTVISTFGLINRGKGLEYAIDAMEPVVAAHPDALYCILGQTHPVIRRQEGESYRAELQGAIAAHGLSNNVMLVDHYLAFGELLAYLQATDIYLTPYLNPVQIVSGTLAYAVGCGKAVVSTPYLYARELLAHGRGFLVNFRDAESIAQTLGLLTADPDLRHATERRAYRFGRQMIWPNVIDAYSRAFAEVGAPLALPA